MGQKLGSNRYGIHKKKKHYMKRPKCPFIHDLKFHFAIFKKKKGKDQVALLPRLKKNYLKGN